MVDFLPLSSQKKMQMQKQMMQPSFGEIIGQGIQQMQARKQQQQQQLQSGQQLKQITGMDISSLPPEMQKAVVVEALKSQGKNSQLGQKLGFLEQTFGGQPQRNMGQQLAGQEPQGQQGQQEGQEFDPTQLSDAQIAQATAIDPNIGRSLQHAKDMALREARGNAKFEQSKFEGERSFHSGLSKKAEEEAGMIRSSLPRKEMALNFARNAVETGDVAYFSPDKLADATGIDLFRTAKGAQLVTAGKENLLGNMSRVSSRAQNMWFEQRLNSMFSKIGQSREANLTSQEMLEAEAAMDKAYLNEFDRLSAQDEEQYGFTRKDIQKRAQDAVAPIQKQIFQRATYRMKEIEEQEKGLTSLKKSVGKNTIKGTPLTLAMAKLYKEKFGDNAFAVAKKNGYQIPTLEEFQTFQARPQEFREQIAQ